MTRPARPAPLIILLVLLAAAAAAPSARAQAERDRPCPPGAPGPATAFTRLAQAGTAKEFPQADWLFVLDQAVNRVEPSGVTYVDLYTLTKILTEAGAVQRAVLEWPYDPRSSFVEVSAVNLIRDGRRLPVDVAQVQDLPAPQAAIYWQDRIRTLQLPRLRPGDGVEVVALRKGYNYALLADGDAPADPPAPMARERIRAAGDDRYVPPMRGEYFDIVLMQADVPIVEKRYTLVLPAGKRLISREYNGAVWTTTEYADSTTSWTWWAEHVPACPHEARQPAASDFAPKVVMTTAASWEAKSEWFFDVNRDQFAVTDDIRRHVEQVLAAQSLTTRSDPLRVATALNHWVAQNIRYSGQTMGAGEGFTLHPSNLLFENRSGVCKDIASMSITLLRAAGLPAYPAMTMAGSRIEDIPADQFNHCVVAWERAPGDFVMLDPTWVPYMNDVWSKLEAEQQYLVGVPGGAHLDEIRYSPPEESPLAVRNDATLAEDGTLSGRLRFDATGALDGRLRALVNGAWKRALVQTAATLLAKLGDRVEIRAVASRAPDDFAGDMWLTVDYVVPQYALSVGDALEFRPPAVNVVKDDGGLFRAGAGDWPPERATDILLYYTQRLDIREEIELPRGYALTGAPRFDSVSDTLAAFTAQAAQAGRKLVLTSRTDVRRRQITPALYPGFRKAICALDNFAATTLRVGKGGSR
jgi:hypothetical protein